jgi:hypothetical protein
VRQFITAGTADQEVPAQSPIARLFLQAIEGEADLTRDGIITGREIGQYLQDLVPRIAPSITPVEGKIHHPGLRRGEFMFLPTQTITSTRRSQAPAQARGQPPSPPLPQIALDRQRWRDMYLQDPPPPGADLDDDKKNFVIVGSHLDAEDARRQATELRRRFPQIDVDVYGRYMGNPYYGVMLASWTSRDRAREALDFARANIVRDAYRWSFP